MADISKIRFGMSSPPYWVLNTNIHLPITPKVMDKLKWSTKFLKPCFNEWWKNTKPIGISCSSLLCGPIVLLLKLPPVSLLSTLSFLRRPSYQSSVTSLPFTWLSKFSLIPNLYNNDLSCLSALLKIIVLHYKLLKRQKSAPKISMTKNYTLVPFMKVTLLYSMTRPMIPLVIGNSTHYG